MAQLTLALLTGLVESVSVNMNGVVWPLPPSLALTLLMLTLGVGIVGGGRFASALFHLSSNCWRLLIVVELPLASAASTAATTCVSVSG